MGSRALSIDPRILGQVLSLWAMKEVRCVSQALAGNMTIPT